MSANKKSITLTDFKCVGNGSFGKVYTGMYNGKRHAVKRRYIATGSKVPPGCVHLNEIHILREMKHPHILHAEYIQRQNPLPDNFRQDSLNPFGENCGTSFRADLVYVISDAADGDLSEFGVTPTGKLDTSEQKEELRSLMWQTLSGLGYLHAKNFIHRDIKPANVLYTKTPTGKYVMICDFDMCMPTIDSYESNKAGTPEYTAPEILVQNHEVAYTQKADIWSTGCIMYHLVKGEGLFIRSSRREADLDRYILAGQKAHLPNGDCISLDTTGIDVTDVKIDLDLGDEQANDLLRKMLDCNPDTRPTVLECMAHPFFQGQAIPTFDPPEDHIIEKHFITEDMAKVFDNFISQIGTDKELYTQEWFGFFLGLDILMRVCTKKYRGNGEQLAICCFNLGMKFFDKEAARFLDIDTEDAKRIEYSIIAEKLQGSIYRNTVYNVLAQSPDRIYRYLLAGKLFPCKFSDLVSAIDDVLHS